MRALAYFGSELVCLVLIFMWIGGVVIADGFWSTLFCLFPFWAWYLFVERAMFLLHFI